MLGMRTVFSMIATVLMGVWMAVPAAVAQTAAAPIELAQANEPADNDIRNVFSDLDRYEQQLAAVASGQEGSASRRILKLLGNTEDRLASSPNKDHASWIEARDRLEALKANLNTMAGQ